MDPLALSGAFATVVGLLANFKAERTGANLDEFMLWLRDHHQEQLAEAITSNQTLARELSTMLAEKHEVLVSRLDELHRQIRDVASHMEGFRGLAQAISGLPELSEQARSVLRQIAESGAKFVLEHKLSTGRPTEFIFIDGAIGQVQYEDPRFINEDLERLVSLQLLRVEYTSKGARKFSVTRAGIALARSDT